MGFGWDCRETSLSYGMAEVGRYKLGSTMSHCVGRNCLRKKPTGREPELRVEQDTYSTFNVTGSHHVCNPPYPSR